MIKFAVSSVILLAAALCRAEIKTQTIEYKQGDTVLKGHLAYDDAAQGKRPGIIIVHEWWGLSDYVKGRAEQLARLGYVAFAADMYGNGTVVNTPDEAGKLAGALATNRDLAKARFKAAMDAIKADSHTDGSKIAAMGYCFGGTIVLEMARAGTDLAGVASTETWPHPSRPRPAL